MYNREQFKLLLKTYCITQVNKDYLIPSVFKNSNPTLLKFSPTSQYSSILSQSRPSSTYNYNQKDTSFTSTQQHNFSEPKNQTPKQQPQSAFYPQPATNLGQPQTYMPSMMHQPDPQSRGIQKPQPDTPFSAKIAENDQKIKALYESFRATQELDLPLLADFVNNFDVNSENFILGKQMFDQIKIFEETVKDLRVRNKNTYKNYSSPYPEPAFTRSSSIFWPDCFKLLQAIIAPHQPMVTLEDVNFKVSQQKKVVPVLEQQVQPPLEDSLTRLLDDVQKIENNNKSLIMKKQDKVDPSD